MIIIPADERSNSDIKGSLQDSTYSFREFSLYGRSVLITEPGFVGSQVPVQSATVLESGLCSREMKNENTVVNVGDLQIGGPRLVVAAGPCAVESEEQITEIAEYMKKAGADMIRGGAFKPRTSPYSFQGLGNEGVRILKRAGESVRLPVVSEIMDISDYGVFRENIDLLQVGSRNSQNFSLLKFLGKQEIPVLLKNGMGNSIDEWMNSGEYILSGGNGNLVMCYRGTRTFESSIRFSMDTGAIIALRNRTHLPVCVDPSHPAGKREYVEALALSAVASGVDMLEIEVHNDPDHAMSDSAQQLTFHMFADLVKKVRRLEELLRDSQ